MLVMVPIVTGMPPVFIIVPIFRVMAAVFFMVTIFMVIAFVLVMMLTIQAQIVAIIAGVIGFSTTTVIGIVIIVPVTAPSVIFGAFGSFLSFAQYLVSFPYCRFYPCCGGRYRSNLSVRPCRF